MRPLKLTVSGFGPYAKEQVFDLEKLGNYGIYLITGDTGAGKTTIFDAINFALFGEASGKDRDGKMLRSKYADLSTETFVELEFLYRDEKYIIKRNPEYERLAKRGKNLTTKQAANATLILPDGKIIDKSEKNVNKKVEEILGITQKQFKQICMIAQGDFMKILQIMCHPDYNGEYRVSNILAKIGENELIDKVGAIFHNTPQCV